MTPPVVADPLPAGTRAWECIPGVIRDDGVDSFRLEVNTNGAVTSVALNGLSPRFTFPASPSVILRDDGTGGDRVAGDYIFTASPITYRPEFEMATHYLNDVSSPEGLEAVALGEVVITESDGNSSRFLIHPSVGLLRADIQPVAAVAITPEITITRNLVNIQSSTMETQSALRGTGGDLRRLTQFLYAVLPDSRHFWCFFSSGKIERVPWTAVENYEAGRHISVQVNYSGTGQTPFNDSGSYESRGTLLGVNIMDAYDRGVYGSNLLHEILHQWAPYLDPALGLADPDGHYKSRSSVGSLLGGQLWVANGDGTYTLDCNEGRNGAHHAAPLDLYLMGLLDASSLGSWYVYSPSSPPPLLRCSDHISDIVTTTTIAQIQQRHGTRIPGPQSALRDFRMGFAIESHDRKLNATELTYYDILAGAFTRPVAEGEPDPYVAFNWAPVSRFFGSGVTWRSEICPPADFTGDGWVDEADFTIFLACSTGPAVAYNPPLPTGCTVSVDAKGFIPPDLDRDRDVDSDDFGAFQREYTAY